MRSISSLAAGLLLWSAIPATAQADSAAFVIRLGTDTTAIERYVRTPDRLVVEAVQRSPSTTLHRMAVDLTRSGDVARAVYTVRMPASTEPAFTRTFVPGGDSATVETVQGGATRATRVAAGNAIPIAGPFYAPYELAMMRLVAGRTPAATVQLLQGGAAADIELQRVGADSIALQNQFGEPMRAHVDARGRLLHLHTPAFTTVERIGWVDLDAVAREFAARDATGRGMGPLSPRHTYRTVVGGANLWVDYSRPGMRGRPIWGALVPYGAVWRMGANDAAHFATDRTVRLGDVTLAPGTYTLFLLPTAEEWSLIVNRQTGISGLERDDARDVGRVALAKQAVERPVEQFTIDVREREGGGTLSLAWGDTRASVPITVVPQP